MKRKVLILLIVILIVAPLVFLTKNLNNKTNNDFIRTNNFIIDLIKNVNIVNKNNYLISPYSIEMALNLVKEGASENTYNQINQVLNHDVNINNNDSIYIANAIFVKDTYEKDLNQDYIKALKNKYSSDILIDEFKTPNIINNWVEKNTLGMIPSILDSVDKDFILGLANAIAIDVKWSNPFECSNTTKEEFTKNNKKKINTEMMHQTYQSGDIKYFETEKAKGVILPYQEETNLEFVGILPKEDTSNYINNLTTEELSNIDKNIIEASSKNHIIVSLPRFTYDYDLSTFKDILMNLGIKDAFNPEKANFNRIISKESLAKYNVENIYINDAIHRAHIELNEEGTKAAAITYFGFKTSSALMSEDYKTYEINFNKTFIYIIRDKTNHSILFFGLVNSPNKWNGSTCTEKSLS